MTVLQHSQSGQVDQRIDDLARLYALLDELAVRTQGPRLMSECSGRMDWPQRGVYFFQEPGEARINTGAGPRIVRVGTHALKSGSKARLWTRLSQHKGQAKSGGGNHRGSIFRLLVGTALIARDGHQCDSWGQGSSAPRDITTSELPMEQRVTRMIGQMPFLCLPIEDEPGPGSLRGVIERNAIALLSNSNRPAIDEPSANWLGHYCIRERVRNSGLWNQNHVDETWEPSFLTTFEELVAKIGR